MTFIGDYPGCTGKYADNMQEAEDIGLTRKEVAEYVREQQTLDKEERAACRDTQKRKVEIRIAELQAEDKKSR